MARCPFAAWRGSPNVGGAPIRPARGLVVHVEVGTEAGTDACFRNPSFQASAHFGCAKDGSLDQWVDTDAVAWAEVAGNAGWISVETEGTPDEALTPAQVASLGRLFAWVRQRYPDVPARACDHDGTGLTTHAHYPSGEPDASWGGHPCPGTLRSAQLPAILTAAAPSSTRRPLMDRQGLISFLANAICARDATADELTNLAKPGVSDRDVVLHFEDSPDGTAIKLSRRAAAGLH